MAGARKGLSMETTKVDASAPGYNPPASPWHEFRRQGLTSTDAANIMGQGYGSRLQVWLDKKGLLPAKETSEAMYWGTKLEPILFEEFSLRTKHRIVEWRSEPMRHALELFNDAEFLRDDRNDGRMCLKRDGWARCTPDAIYAGKGHGLLECKTTAFRNGDAWREQPPLAAQIQAQWQLYVSGLEHGALVCLIGGQRFVGYEFTRNDAFIAHMAEEAERFWVDFVLADREPAAEERDLDMVKSLALARPGVAIELPADAEHIDAMLEEAKAREKSAKADIEARQAQLIRWMGEAEYGRLPGSGVAYRLHKYERAGYEVKPSTVRTLRRIEQKS